MTQKKRKKKPLSKKSPKQQKARHQARNARRAGMQAKVGSGPGGSAYPVRELPPVPVWRYDEVVIELANTHGVEPVMAMEKLLSDPIYLGYLGASAELNYPSDLAANMGMELIAVISWMQKLRWYGVLEWDEANRIHVMTVPEGVEARNADDIRSWWENPPDEVSNWEMPLAAVEQTNWR